MPTPADHRPVHCHVSGDGFEIRVFLPSLAVNLKRGKMPDMGEIKTILAIVSDHRNEIGQE
ncbi:MAG: DUF4160 domain-containing protein [Oligoflexus sp.]|nr:DUF4160 domain-containing protein [Oligoflexus sp.]